MQPLHLAIRVRGEPLAFIPQLRQAAGAVDPRLRVEYAGPLDTVNRGEVRFYEFWLRLAMMLSVTALVLSLAGIYAVMSFAVARRTREIGIRIALGAQVHRLLLGVLRQPLIQVGGGIIAGSALTLLLLMAAEGRELSVKDLAGFGVYALLITSVCTLACVLPVRRALTIEPTESLRADS